MLINVIEDIVIEEFLIVGRFRILRGVLKDGRVRLVNF